MNLSHECVDQETMRSFVNQLDHEEVDALKYRLSVAGASLLDNSFDLSSDQSRLRQFNETVKHLASIHPFSKHLPKYASAYRGRPHFMTDHLLSELQAEAIRMRSKAVPNYCQFLTTVDTPNGETVSERLAASKVLLDFVTKYTVPCLHSFVTSYIYYDSAGLCSHPHVDNAFTAITVMVGLRHDCEDGIFNSRSVVYWPDQPRLDYQLRPGEISIFYGVSALHGRTPVTKGENVHSLLMSFRPTVF